MKKIYIEVPSLFYSLLPPLPLTKLRQYIVYNRSPPSSLPNRPQRKEEEEMRGDRCGGGKRKSTGEYSKEE